MSGVKEFIYVPARGSNGKLIRFMCGLINTGYDFDNLSLEVKKYINEQFSKKEIEVIKEALNINSCKNASFYFLDELCFNLPKAEEFKREIVEFESEPKVESISYLKKQIKNCKNPMQLKELNQKLNAAYKKRKKKN